MTGLQPEVLLSRDDVRKTKPHPDQLFEALRILDSVPEKSMMVGDHPMDILAGKSAEMRTVGVLLPDRPEDFFDQAKPDAVVRSLKELVDALIDCYC
jgi:phosphoglycolate phosphatase-like HAD superfamily hydrolase